jgi:hypothetical protein
MPTKQAQAVINAAIPLALRYALLKEHYKQSKPHVIMEGGYVEIHNNEGIDMENELDNLLNAVLELVE